MHLHSVYVHSTHFLFVWDGQIRKNKKKEKNDKSEINELEMGKVAAASATFVAATARALREGFEPPIRNL